MPTTLRNWFRNAGDRLDLMFTEELSWLVLVATTVVVLGLVRRRARWPSVLATAGVGLWLVATLAMTIYPIAGELEGPSADRLELKSIVPLWGTIESIANSGDYLMTDEEFVRRRAEIAEEWGVPPEEVRYDRRVQGPGLAAVLKDPIGNVVLFLPLGFLLALGWPPTWRWAGVLGAGAAVSTAIETSQVLFGLGSLGTIDDVIFNATGALAGYGLFVGSRTFVTSVEWPGR